MQYKTLKIGLFVLLALAQLYFPASMIWQQQKTITEGKAYRFETAPVDPNDPFRGKYITLRFETERYKSDQINGLPESGEVFVLLGEDEKGFAKIEGVQAARPDASQDYMTANISRKYEERNLLILKFPFNRYYMEESKAYEAELAYRRARIDSAGSTYALVMVKEGKTALEDVILGGVSIKEVVEAVGD